MDFDEDNESFEIVVRSQRFQEFSGRDLDSLASLYSMPQFPAINYQKN